MEPHKTLPDGIEEFRPRITDGPISYFKKAWEFTNRFYKGEVDRISSIKLENVSPEFFFAEYMWVVHATGFSAKAVSKFLPKLVEAYGSLSELGIEEFDTAFSRVKIVCNNSQKAKAVWKTARLIQDPVRENCWEQFRSARLSSPELLSELPYIGKITCFHLGRNIGLLECVKPDLHLVRMAEHWGFSDCIAMCRVMRDSVDQKLPLGIVDLALWYSASTFGTLEIRQEGSR